jgi:hypothetical protein
VIADRQGAVSDAGRSTTGSPKDSDTADLKDAETLLDELSSPPLSVLCNTRPNFDAKLRLGSLLSSGTSQLIRAR